MPDEERVVIGGFFISMKDKRHPKRINDIPLAITLPVTFNDLQMLSRDPDALIEGVFGRNESELTEGKGAAEACRKSA